MLCFIVFFPMKIKKDTWARRQSLRGVLSRKRQAETDAHVHSSDSNKEPIVGSTCLRKPPVCSWLGGSAAKSLFITPTAPLRPLLPLCHVHLLSTPLDNLGGFISMQWVCLKGVEIQHPDKVGGSSFDWSRSSQLFASQISQYRKSSQGHTLSQWASPSSLLSSQPAAVARLPHINGYYWLPWRNYPETSLRLSCMQPATHTRPGASRATFQWPIKSNCHIIQ